MSHRSFVKRALVLGGVAASLVTGARLGAAKDIEVDDVRVTAAANREGRATFTPWSGIWWPLSSTKLAKGWNGSGDDFSYDATAKVWKRTTGSQAKTANDLSPLLKYDEYVKRTTGTDPGSALLECTGDAATDFMHNVYGAQKEKYDADGISYSWWGHCNGWSAAAILEKEPIGPVEASGIRFEVADQKGLLTESFYGVQSDFTGLRYEQPEASIRESREPGKVLLAALVANAPRPVAEYIAWYEKAWATKMTDAAKASAKAADFKDELELFEKWYVDNYEKPYDDLPPHVFHKIIETVIGRKKLALVFDITANDEVWNHPAFAYTSAIAFVRDFNENGVARKEWSVTTTVHYATDGVSESVIGVSTFTRTYTYKLVTDATGKLLAGTWTGSSVDDHPDFAWLPLSNPTTADPGENRKLLFGKLLEILPAAHGTSEARAIDLAANGTAASARRANDRTTTWGQPVAASGDVAFTVAVAAARPVAKVSYFEQPVTAAAEPAATRAPLVALGTSTTGPAFSVAKPFATAGKKMVLAYAYDAAGRLVGYDEITVQYTLGGGGTNPVPADDIFEPNQSKGTATAVNAGSYPNLVCNDDDWFKVTLAQPGTIDVKIAFQNSQGDLDMSLEGPTAQIAKSTTTANEERCVGQGLAAGTYTVRVYGYGGARAKYALTVTTTSGGPAPSTDDAYEANNDRATAAALAAGTHNLVSQEDDWFKVTLATAGTITAKIDFRNAESDLDLFLADSSGAVLVKSDSTADGETVTKASLAAGTYYVRVQKYSGARSLYTMTLTVSGTTPTPTVRTGTITATTLNIRSGAGTTSPVVTTRTNGQVVTILEERTGFYRVTWTGAPAGELWGSASYIRIN